MNDKLVEAKRHLGQQGSYSIQTDKFDPTLLVRVSRDVSRERWDIDPKKFVGYDVWNCHEATFLTNKGLPIAGTLKVFYSSTSKFIVESKSFKLFLNSFDMCKMGPTIQESIINYELQVKQSLEQLIECRVDVKFFSPISDGCLTVDVHQDFHDLYSTLKANRELENLNFIDYKSEKSHLRWVDFKSSKLLQYKYTINTLRSRCLVTNQKDTGTAFIMLCTQNGYIDEASILQHVVSLRETNEFHEPAAEKLISDFMKFPGVVGCYIALLYARRGSLDINPIRASSMDYLYNDFFSLMTLNKKTLGQ